MGHPEGEDASPVGGMSLVRRVGQFIDPLRDQANYFPRRWGLRALRYSKISRARRRREGCNEPSYAVAFVRLRDHVVRHELPAIRLSDAFLEISPLLGGQVIDTAAPRFDFTRNLLQLSCISITPDTRFSARCWRAACRMLRQSTAADNVRCASLWTILDYSRLFLAARRKPDKRRNEIRRFASDAHGPDGLQKRLQIVGSERVPADSLIFTGTATWSAPGARLISS